jgi:RNA polymerase sigma factor (sigma-70 family)
MDDDGFAAFYAAQHSGLVRALTVVAGDAEAATDAADEAFARALERWSRVRDMASPGGWTYRVALHALRRRQRRGALERTLLQRHRPPVTAPPDLGDPDLWRAVRRLPERQRTAVALRYIADLPEARVAEAMGIAPGTVAATLHRARRRLEQDLARTHQPLGDPRV